jgi:hypothetical protein
LTTSFSLKIREKCGGNVRRTEKMQKTILSNYNLNKNNELYKDKNIPYNEINAGE